MIQLYDDMCLAEYTNKCLIRSVYPNININYKTKNFFWDRAFSCTTNKFVDTINHEVLPINDIF